MDASQKTLLTANRVPAKVSEKSFDFLPDSPLIEGNASSSQNMNETHLADAEGQVWGDGSNSGNNGDYHQDKKPKDHGAPGSAWSHSKASDEYERASAGLVDKNWNMDKYGELLDDEDELLEDQKK